MRSPSAAGSSGSGSSERRADRTSGGSEQRRRRSHLRVVRSCLLLGMGRRSLDCRRGCRGRDRASTSNTVCLYAQCAAANPCPFGREKPMRRSLSKRRLFLVAALSVAVVSATATAAGCSPSISKAPFGSTGGQAVDRYTLRNCKDMEVKILTYGGILQEVS